MSRHAVLCGQLNMICLTWLHKLHVNFDTLYCNHRFGLLLLFLLCRGISCCFVWIVEREVWGVMWCCVYDDDDDDDDDDDGGGPRVVQQRWRFEEMRSLR